MHLGCQRTTNPLGLIARYASQDISHKTAILLALITALAAQNKLN